MAEEVRDAPKNVPKTVMMMLLIHFSFVFVGIVTLAYHVTDVNAALNDPTSWPFVWVMRQAMSTPWIMVLLALTLFLNEAANIVYVAAVVRDLFACFILSTSCLLWRRIYKPETLPPAAAFSLGRWGILINAACIIYSSWGFFWLFWPTQTPITAANFNWTAPIFGVIILFALVYFQFRAKHRYFGPVVEVEGRMVRKNRYVKM
jgi:hypothetical protein